MIKDDSGAHAVKTLGGCTLTVNMNGDKINLTDERATLQRLQSQAWDALPPCASV
jgi:hypothetical protein